MRWRRWATATRSRSSTRTSRGVASARRLIELPGRRRTATCSRPSSRCSRSTPRRRLPCSRCRSIGDREAVPDRCRFRRRSERVLGANATIGALERLAFYERARNAFAVVRTGELRPYGNDPGQGRRERVSAAAARVIVVFGSINLDLVARVGAIPRAGRDAARYVVRHRCQAARARTRRSPRVARARRSRMFGAVGRDAFARGRARQPRRGAGSTSRGVRAWSADRRRADQRRRERRERDHRGCRRQRARARDRRCATRRSRPATPCSCSSRSRSPRSPRSRAARERAARASCSTPRRPRALPADAARQCRLPGRQRARARAVPWRARAGHRPSCSRWRARARSSTGKAMRYGVAPPAVDVVDTTGAGDALCGRASRRRSTAASLPPDALARRRARRCARLHPRGRAARRDGQALRRVTTVRMRSPSTLSHCHSRHVLRPPPRCSRCSCRLALVRPAAAVDYTDIWWTCRRRVAGA